MSSYSGSVHGDDDTPAQQAASAMIPDPVSGSVHGDGDTPVQNSASAIVAKTMSGSVRGSGDTLVQQAASAIVAQTVSHDGGDDETSAQHTASAIVAEAMSKSHVLKIKDYSQTKGFGVGVGISSDTFYVGGDTWVRCDVAIAKEIRIEATTTKSVVVPPSDMHHHLGRLLSAGEGADVTFEVGGKTFAVHRCVLAARSPVFMAELFGPMKEKTATRVQIDDMEAIVFKALLHFIYTDSLPEMEEGDSLVMAQHLLVAADRYDLKRLKLICEDMLCNNINTKTAATTLALAEQHDCCGLKEACFKFLAPPGSNLKVVMASDGFEHLRSICPSVVEELLAKFDLKNDGRMGERPPRHI